MKTATLACSVLLLVLATGCDDPPYVPKARVDSLESQISQLRAELATAKAERVNRWRIEMRSGVRADTYLLDTESGRVWREYEVSEGKMSWQETPRSDRPWLAGNGLPGQYSPEVEQVIGKWITAGWSRPNAINQLRRVGILGEEAPDQPAANAPQPK